MNGQISLSDYTFLEPKICSSISLRTSKGFNARTDEIFHRQNLENTNSDNLYQFFKESGLDCPQNSRSGLKGRTQTVNIVFKLCLTDQNYFRKFFVEFKWIELYVECMLKSGRDVIFNEYTRFRYNQKTNLSSLDIRFFSNSLPFLTFSVIYWSIPITKVKLNHIRS